MKDQDMQNTGSGQTARKSTDKLIQLNEKTKVPVSDLNNRLGEIESELKHLNARESATNKSFRELLSETRKHTSAQKEELSETRDRMDDITSKYNKMTQDYQRLAAGANILSATLEQARSELSTDISALKVAADERMDELGEAQLQMIERANRIEERANQMSRDLDSRVNIIRTTINALENKLQAEIREVAQQSEQRDEALTIRTNMIEENFNNEVVNIRQVHTELDDRTTILEAASDALIHKTDDLQYQSNIMDTRTIDLEDRSDRHEEQIERQANALKDTDNTIQRHHRGFAVALVLIAATLGIFSYQQQNRLLNSEASDIALSDTLASQSALINENGVRISALEANSTANHTDLKKTVGENQQQILKLEKDIEALQHRSSNTSHRLSAISPYRSFGIDNTIQPASWLAQQNSEAYVVEVATLNSKDAMYRTAQRWASMLNSAKLSYIETQIDNQTVYTMYYGPFENAQDAERVSYRIPAMNYDSRPVARQVAEIFAAK